MNWQIFGLVAGAVTMAGFVPQIAKGYKTKHLKDLSYMMNVLLLTGMAMWLFYGLNKKDNAILFTNVTGIILNLTLIAMKYHYSKTSEKLEKNH